MKLIPIALQAVNTAAAAFVAYSHNLAVSRTGQGQPVSPEAIQAAGEAVGQLQPSNADDGGGAVGPQQPSLRTIHAQLEELREPLLRAMDANETGDSFAETLVRWKGQLFYDRLHDLGAEALITVLSTYPPIWEVVSRVPSKFQAFLAEFMTFGEAETALSNAGVVAESPRKVVETRHKPRGIPPTPGADSGSDGLSG